jgi:SAM-dependent methyltransferase
MPDIEWSQLYKNRQAVADRYRSIWQVPLKKRYSNVLFDLSTKPQAVLEFGAGARKLEDKVKKRWPGCEYASFDIDESRFHDFYKLEAVSGEYDIVCMFEVIEHVRPELAVEMLSKSFEVLNSGGLLVVTTPNIFYPPAFLRDATHITPWCYDELGGVTALAGFEVQDIYRLYKESILKTLVRRYLCYPVFRLLGIDFAKQIIVVAKKP